MNKLIFRTTLVIAVALLLSVFGCKKADPNKPIPEVKAEAQQMDASQVRDMAIKYRDAIKEKAGEVQEEATKLSKLSPADMVGQKGAEIKAKMEEYKKQVDALKERLQIYIDELKKKGGDITGLQI